MVRGKTRRLISMSESGTNVEVSYRLSAILFADMVGYSSLPQGEALRQKEEMLALARESFSRRGGRLVKTLGDGFLAEFPAVTEAVAFALDLQGRIARRNTGVAARRRFRVRMGVHAGEVVVRGDDVEGATVNVAARTEAVAAPGGICLTEPVWQQTREILAHPADRLGRLHLKGIGRQFCFYHLAPQGSGWSGRAWLRARLFFNWPGRAPAALVVMGIMVALGVWLRPYAGEILAHLFPPTTMELAQGAERRLERFDRPGALTSVIKELRQALVLDPGFTEARAALALAYWRQYKTSKDLGDRFDAWNESSNVLARFPDSCPAQFVQGMVACDERRLEEASNHFARANLAANWENGEVLVQLAMTCQWLKDPSNALYFERKALAVQRKPWYFFNALGTHRLYLGDYVGAQTNYRAALDLTPDNPVAWLNLGQALDLEYPNSAPVRRRGTSPGGH